MRKIIKTIVLMILLVSSLVSSISIAQDNYPTPFLFNYKANGVQYTNQPFDSSKFVQNNFYLSTQWGGHPRMLKALKMNANMNHYPNGPSVVEYNDSTDGKLFYIYEGGEDNETMGFQYEPTLEIPVSQRGNFITRNSQIFGFANRKGEVLSDENDPNYDRLILDTNGTYVDTVVLSKSWINNQFLNKTPDLKDTLYDGTRWVFSINLRRKDIAEHKKGNTPVLTIKLPFKMIGDTNKYYIKFRGLSDSSNSISLLTFKSDGINDDTLGYDNNYTTFTNDTTYHFTIYDNMLPDSLFFANNKRQDITLNAYFICNNLPINNPLLKKKNVASGIDSLDIEVTYHGNTNIAINYLRIATPYALDFYKGPRMDSYRDTIQNMINHVEGRGYEIFGLYGRDEYRAEYYSGQRYNAELLNFQVMSEGAGEDYFKHYEYHIKPKNHWIGANGLGPNISAPYFWVNTTDYGHQMWQTIYGESNLIAKSKRWMNYRRGYRGHYGNGTLSTDSSNSSYETDLFCGACGAGKANEGWRKYRENAFSFDLIMNSLTNDQSTLGYADKLSSIPFRTIKEKLFPNPTYQNLTIPKTYFNENFIYFNIIDMTGKDIYRYNKTPNLIFNEDLLVDVSRYMKGSYIVQFFYENSSMPVGVKFIKGL